MKLQMAKNSLFAVLLRSPWWVSALIAIVIALVSVALLPAEYRAVGALSGLPFVVISVLAARRQWRLPSAARVAATQESLAKMPWPAFAALLEQSFRRDGYAIEPGPSAGVDFTLERQGRRVLVSARRWKSARTGMEALRALQAAREATDATDALYIGLGELTDTARSFATAHRIDVWHVAELAHALRGLPLGAAAAR
ncbi:MAG TPA: restriction endonuclease [Caldimonas sp.]|nr:restriction endonuclease [Caldimonas sp.]HEX2541392.1 restriction endonuclease [Caldimonas sp.]